jgi:hypothetical protein
LSSLHHILNDILASSGYATSVDGDIVTGEKGGIKVEMLCCETPECDVLAFLNRPGAGHKIVAALIDLDSDIAVELEGRASLWTKGMIEHEIGRVHIQRIIGEREPGLLDELEAGSSPRHQAEEPREHLVRPFMSAADVKEVGAKTVGGFRYRLELVPHHLFLYEAPVRIDGAECGRVKGQIAINALTGFTAEWPVDSETVTQIEEAHRVLEPTIDREDAKGMARKGVVALYTSERDVVREAHGAVITERKKVMPLEADVCLEGSGLYFLPIWLVEGLRGVLIINAATGKIVSEDLYSKDLA